MLVSRANKAIIVTGNESLIPKMRPEKWPQFLREAAGAKIAPWGRPEAVKVNKGGGELLFILFPIRVMCVNDSLRVSRGQV